MKTTPWLKVLSGRLMKPGIEPTTPGLEVIKLEFILRLKIKQQIIVVFLRLKLYSSFITSRPGLHGEQFIHKTTAAPIKMIAIYKDDSYPF